MRNITFRADANDIALAKEQARAEGTTLNAQFQLWLAGYVLSQQSTSEPARAAAIATINRLRAHVSTDERKLIRDQLTER